MEEKNYTVYMHKNKINGKVYIGITKQEPEKRWKNGWGYYTQLIFWRAICKYTFNGFEHIIIERNLTKEEACKKEIELIAKYKSNNYKYGYNVSSGGDGTNDVKATPEARRKNSVAHLGNQNAKGYKHTIEEKQKMRLAKLGKPNIKLSKRVMCIETRIIYSSVAEARRNTKINHIDQVCRGERNYAGKIENIKLHWKYVEEE